MSTLELRRRAVVARGVLREVLAECVGGAPGDLRLEADPGGKPRLAAGTGPEGLAFNLGHSGDVAVVAVAADREVGVDVELLPRPGVERLAKRFLHPAELAAAPAAGADRDEWLLAAWVRKEASAKLDGRGLRRDLRTVRLKPLDAGPGRWRGVDPEKERRWVVEDVRPAPDVLVAVAAEGEDWRLVARG